MALLLSLLLGPYLEPDIFLLFRGGRLAQRLVLRPHGGLIATAASAVAILYLLPPAGSGATRPPSNVLSRLIAFVVMASLITWVTAAWRESRRLLAATLSSIADAVLATDARGPRHVS